MDDILRHAAREWWYEKARGQNIGDGSNLDHAKNPTVGCNTAAERALALAVAADLQIQWIHEAQARAALAE